MLSNVTDSFIFHNCHPMLPISNIIARHNLSTTISLSFCEGETDHKLRITRRPQSVSMTDINFFIKKVCVLGLAAAPFVQRNTRTPFVQRNTFRAAEHLSCSGISFIQRNTLCTAEHLSYSGTPFVQRNTFRIAEHLLYSRTPTSMEEFPQQKFAVHSTELFRLMYSLSSI